MPASSLNDTVIKTQGLSKQFAGSFAVKSLDLEVKAGQVYGFLGPNGCGKSTTIRMLCGLLKPSGGEVSVLGFDMKKQAEQAKRRIGYMTQNFSLYQDLSVLENLHFVADVYGFSRRESQQRIAELLQTYHLNRLKNQLAGTMSGGQRQRLALAAAILHRPELLFLDEPTSAVDPESRREFWQSLFALTHQGTTLLVSTHYMDEAERCHKLAILQEGQLMAEGSPDDLMRALPSETLLVHCHNPYQAQQQIQAIDGVLSCAQIGSSLRVLVQKNHHTEKLIEQQLALLDMHATISPVPANLEDVFVSTTQNPAQGRLP